MSIIPKHMQAIPDPIEVQGYWTGWQVMGHRGPGRWSSEHYTLTGLRTLCGKNIPNSNRLFRCETGVADHRCPTCERKLGQKIGRGEYPPMESTAKPRQRSGSARRVHSPVEE